MASVWFCSNEPERVEGFVPEILRGRTTESAGSVGDRALAEE